jgi:hypothetical protein
MLYIVWAYITRITHTCFETNLSQIHSTHRIKRRRSNCKYWCYLLTMIVTEFPPAQRNSKHTARRMQHYIQMDLKASCPSSTTVEANSDTSPSTVQVRNAIQIELFLQYNLRKHVLLFSSEPEFKRPCIILPLLLPAYIVWHFSYS